MATEKGLGSELSQAEQACWPAREKDGLRGAPCNRPESEVSKTVLRSKALPSRCFEVLQTRNLLRVCSFGPGAHRGCPLQTCRHPPSLNVEHEPPTKSAPTEWPSQWWQKKGTHRKGVRFHSLLQYHTVLNGNRCIPAGPVSYHN
jgi:hypothetical protein